MKTTTIILICVIAVLAGLGCAALSEYVTPARLEPKAIEYAEKADTIDANSVKGYQNMEKLVRLDAAVDAAHLGNQLFYSQLMEKDALDYSVINGAVAASLTAARNREEALFGETGLLSIGLTAAGFGTLTGLVGLMRKRPQDVTQEEVESILADLKIELSDKDRQLVELIRGIKAFMDAAPSESGDVVIAELKKYLSTAQSTDTKIKVAETKATLT
jgi:hypothetical protein